MLLQALKKLILLFLMKMSKLTKNIVFICPVKTFLISVRCEKVKRKKLTFLE